MVTHEWILTKTGQPGIDYTISLKGQLKCSHRMYRVRKLHGFILVGLLTLLGIKDNLKNAYRVRFSWLGRLLPAIPKCPPHSVIAECYFGYIPFQPIWPDETSEYFGISNDFPKIAENWLRLFPWRVTNAVLVCAPFWFVQKLTVH